MSRSRSGLLRAPLVAAALALLAAGCGVLEALPFTSDGNVSPGDPPVRTERETYALEATPTSYRVEVTATYTNRTGGTVYLQKCGHTPPAFTLQKEVGGEWVDAWRQACALVLVPPVEIPPGESYTTTARIHAARTPNALPRFEVEEVPGTYRLVFQMLRTWDPHGSRPGLDPPLPLEARVSNPFRITL